MQLSDKTPRELCDVEKVHLRLPATYLSYKRSDLPAKISARIQLPTSTPPVTVSPLLPLPTSTAQPDAIVPAPKFIAADFGRIGLIRIYAGAPPAITTYTVGDGIASDALLAQKQQESERIVATFPVDESPIEIGKDSSNSIRVYKPKVTKHDIAIYFLCATKTAYLRAGNGVRITINGSPVPSSPSVLSGHPLRDGDRISTSDLSFDWYYHPKVEQLTDEMLVMEPGTREARITVLQHGEVEAAAKKMLDAAAKKIFGPTAMVEAVASLAKHVSFCLGGLRRIVPSPPAKTGDTNSNPGYNFPPNTSIDSIDESDGDISMISNASDASLIADPAILDNAITEKVIIIAKESVKVSQGPKGITNGHTDDGNSRKRTVKRVAKQLLSTKGPLNMRLVSTPRSQERRAEIQLGPNPLDAPLTTLTSQPTIASKEKFGSIWWAKNEEPQQPVSTSEDFEKAAAHAKHVEEVEQSLPPRVFSPRAWVPPSHTVKVAELRTEVNGKRPTSLPRGEEEQRIKLQEVNVHCEAAWQKWLKKRSLPNKEKDPVAYHFVQRRRWEVQEGAKRRAAELAAEQEALEDPRFKKTWQDLTEHGIKPTDYDMIALCISKSEDMEREEERRLAAEKKKQSDPDAMDIDEEIPLERPVTPPRCSTPPQLTTPPRSPNPPRASPQPVTAPSRPLERLDYTRKRGTPVAAKRLPDSKEQTPVQSAPRVAPESSLAAAFAACNAATEKQQKAAQKRHPYGERPGPRVPLYIGAAPKSKSKVSSSISAPPAVRLHTGNAGRALESIEELVEETSSEVSVAPRESSTLVELAPGRTDNIVLTAQPPAESHPTTSAPSDPSTINLLSLPVALAEKYKNELAVARSWESFKGWELLELKKKFEGMINDGIEEALATANQAYEIAVADVKKLEDAIQGVDVSPFKEKGWDRKMPSPIRVLETPESMRVNGTAGRTQEGGRFIDLTADDSCEIAESELKNLVLPTVAEAAVSSTPLTSSTKALRIDTPQVAPVVLFNTEQTADTAASVDSEKMDDFAEESAVEHLLTADTAAEVVQTPAVLSRPELEPAKSAPAPAPVQETPVVSSTAPQPVVVLAVDPTAHPVVDLPSNQPSRKKRALVELGISSRSPPAKRARTASYRRVSDPAPSLLDPETVCAVNKPEILAMDEERPTKALRATRRAPAKNGGRRVVSEPVRRSGRIASRSGAAPVSTEMMQIDAPSTEAAKMPVSTEPELASKAAAAAVVVVESQEVPEPEQAEKKRPVKALRKAPTSRTSDASTASSATLVPNAPTRTTRGSKAPVDLAAVKPVDKPLPAVAAKTTRKRTRAAEDDPTSAGVEEEEEPARKTRTRKTAALAEQKETDPKPAKKARTTKPKPSPQSAAPLKAVKPAPKTRKAAASRVDKENAPVSVAAAAVGGRRTRSMTRAAPVM